MIEVLETGLQATVQDLGRPGLGHLGVPQAGAADPFSLRLANRLVGNDEGDAAIEVLLGGLVVRFVVACSFAVSGAPCPLSLDGRAIGVNSWAHARAGQTLRLRPPSHGLRSYLAVAGGIDVPRVLGSRSTDTLSGLGPSPLRSGVLLGRGAGAAGPGAAVDVVVSPTVSAARTIEVRLRLGPRDDMFGAEQVAQLWARTWRVSPETDRVAARLEGPALLVTGAGQLPTEGLALGSVQVPPSGQPIVHLANHPPTGGYPVVGVVDRVDVARIAQAIPGTRLRFLQTAPVSFP